MPLSENQFKKQGQKGDVGKGVGQKEIGKYLKRVGLPRDLHEIGGLGTCMLLMNYLTQINSIKTISKL